MTVWRDVFKVFLKAGTRLLRSQRGKLFQTRDAATRKTQSPIVFSVESQMTSLCLHPIHRLHHATVISKVWKVRQFHTQYDHCSCSWCWPLGRQPGGEGDNGIAIVPHEGDNMVPVWWLLVTNPVAATSTHCQACCFFPAAE